MSFKKKTSFLCGDERKPQSLMKLILNVKLAKSEELKFIGIKSKGICSTMGLWCLSFKMAI